MEDRYNEILSQYDFEVTARSRIRGGIMIETDAGCKIVKETKTSAGRLVWEHKVKSHLKEEGFGYIDSFCLNRDNNISSIGTNGQRYVVRDWYPGSECDIHNVKDVYAASVNMAVLHNCLKGIPPYEYSMCAGAQDIVTTLKKHNKELGHIRNYLRAKKYKNEYEMALLRAFPDYYNIAAGVFDCLESSRLNELIRAACGKHEVIHGSYTYHNIIMCGDYIATTVFDKCTYGLWLMDLYYYIRKVMEKNEWNPEYGHAVLSGYESVRFIPDEERAILAMLLLYPEKFWKLASCYMNSQKTWIPGKNMEKLNALCIQRDSREKFIKGELLKEQIKFDIM